MTTSTKRLEKVAAKVLGADASPEQVRELAERVAESLAARRAPKTAPEWVGYE